LDVACQGLQEVDDLEFPDRARIQPEVEVTEVQPGRYRKLLPVEVELPDRRLAARRPGAATMRLLSSSAFVEEDDHAALWAGFF
jgi:hypothetical protein